MSYQWIWNIFIPMKTCIIQGKNLENLDIVLWITRFQKQFKDCAYKHQFFSIQQIISFLQLQYSLFLILMVCILTLNSVYNVFNFQIFSVQDFYLSFLLSVWLCCFFSQIKKYNNHKVARNFYLLLQVLHFARCYTDGNRSSDQWKGDCCW